MISEETQRGDRVAGQLQRDEDRRDGVGGDQHAVLRHLGVGHTLHPPEHRIGEHHTGTDQQTGSVGHPPGKRPKATPTPGHLTDNIGGGGNDQADHGNHTGGLGCRNDPR